jgi:hypothetical protein
VPSRQFALQRVAMDFDGIDRTHATVAFGSQR